MPNKKKVEEGRVKCPRCKEKKHTRIVAREKGYNPRLIHYVCDSCEIGWYMKSGARTESLFTGYTQGAIEQMWAAAKNAYVPKRRPS